MFLLYNIISTIFLVISPLVIIVRMIIGDMLEALVIVLLKASKIEVKSQHQKVSLA